MQRSSFLLLAFLLAGIYLMPAGTQAQQLSPAQQAELQASQREAERAARKLQREIRREQRHKARAQRQQEALASWWARHYRWVLRHQPSYGYACPCAEDARQLQGPAIALHLGWGWGGYPFWGWYGTTLFPLGQHQPGTRAHAYSDCWCDPEAGPPPMPHLEDLRSLRSNYRLHMAFVFIEIFSVAAEVATVASPPPQRGGGTRTESQRPTSSPRQGRSAPRSR